MGPTARQRAPVPPVWGEDAEGRLLQAHPRKGLAGGEAFRAWPPCLEGDPMAEQRYSGGEGPPLHRGVEAGAPSHLSPGLHTDGRNQLPQGGTPRGGSDGGGHPSCFHPSNTGSEEVPCGGTAYSPAQSRYNCKAITPHPDFKTPTESREILV